MIVNIEVDELEGEAMYRSFTELLDRGKLLEPSTAALEVTLEICHIWREVVKEENNRRKMFESSLPRNVFVELVRCCLIDNVVLQDITCSEGHSFINKLLRQMSTALFNLFAGNMVRDINSTVHSKLKPPAQRNKC